MAVIYVNSLAQATVQAAISGSSSGDTIVMPAGSADWSSLLSGNDGIGGLAGRTLIGSGATATVITDKCQAASGYGVIKIESGTILRNFTIQADDTLFSQALIQGLSAVNIVIDNVYVLNVIRRGIEFISSTNGPHSTGVIYNSRIIAKSYPGDPGGGAFQLLAVNGPDNPNSSTPPSQSTADGSWAYAPGFGTASAIFLEDCVISQDAQGDSTVETYDGGKVVVRYNTITNLELGVHGRDSSVRSGHMVELYNNTVLNNIGTDHIGTVTSRGGTGVIWGNDITQTSDHGSSTSSNNIYLQVFRAAGTLNVDPALRFLYNGGQLDGHSPYDGNSAVTHGTGTHTGSNGAANLTDGTKSWTANELAGTGDYTAGNTLQSYWVWNLTIGAGGQVTANTGTTATAILAGGTRQTWNAGDTYVITFGYPGLDQNGRSGPTAIAGVQSTQTLNPWYTWDNTFNGTPDQLPFTLTYMTSDYTSLNQPDSGLFVQSGREYVANIPKPGYTPYAYPHPLRGMTMTVTTLNVGTLNLG